MVKIIDKFSGDVSGKDIYIQLSADSDDEISESLCGSYDAIEITSGENICLDTNGVSLIQSSALNDTAGSMFRIRNGKMTVENSSIHCWLHPRNYVSGTSYDYAMFRLDKNGKLEINSGEYNADYYYNKVIAAAADLYQKSAYDSDNEYVLASEGCPEGALVINGGTFKTRIGSVLTGGIINGGDFNGSYRFTNDSKSSSASGYYGAKGVINKCTLNGTFIHSDSGDEAISSKSGVKSNGVLQSAPYAEPLTGSDIVIDRMYTVTFDTNGRGTAPAAQEVFCGDKAVKPADPAASGYVFKGWYKFNNSSDRFRYDFDTPVTADLTLYGIWQGDSIVTFDVGEGMGISPALQCIPAGGKAVCPKEPRYMGYVFMGWYTDNTVYRTKFDFDSEVTEDITLYALWKEPVSGQITLKTRDLTTYGAYSGDEIILVAPEDFEKDYSWTVTTSDGTTTELSTGKSFKIPYSYRTAGTQSTFKVTGKVWNSNRGIYVTESASFKLIVVNKPGDCATNGLWDKYDASFILKYISGTRSFSEESLNLSETNNDGSIDMLDVVNVLKAMEDNQ